MKIEREDLPIICIANRDTMKDLLKQYIEKGYEPTFYRMISKGGIIDYYPIMDYEFDELPVEKLELYLMRDWLEAKGVLVVEDVVWGEWKISKKPWYVTIHTHNSVNEISMEFSDKTEALKSALEEAIKHV